MRTNAVFIARRVGIGVAAVKTEGYIPFISLRPLLKQYKNATIKLHECSLLSCKY